MNEVLEAQEELWPELKVEHHWFHVVRALIMRGKIRDMGANAWAVYCIIKAHTALNDGSSWPSQAKIGSLMGTSVDTVARATDRLLDLGLVGKRKIGNRNEYYLIEEIPMTREGEMVAVGKRQYAPLMFQKFVEDLKQFARTGARPTDREINIVLNVSIINQGDNSTLQVGQLNVGASAGLPNQDMDRIKKALKQID